MVEKKKREKFPDQFISEALERSLRNAPHLKAEHSVLVATCRMMADRLGVLEANDFMVDGKFDNVTLPTFLKYLDALGLTIHTEDTKGSKTSGMKKTVAQPRNDLQAFMDRHRQSA
jgi:hypothetical protein